MFSNTALLGVADILATFSVRGLQVYFTTRTGFIISFSIVFAISLFYYTVSHITSLVAIGILLMRFGVTAAFSYSYYGSSEYFHTDLSSTAFGICNTMARFSTIISPMLAEVLEQPLILLTILTFISGGASYFLIKPQNILISQAEQFDNSNNQNEEMPDVVRDFYGDSNMQEEQKDDDKKTEPDNDENSFQDNLEDKEEKIHQKEKFIIIGEDGEDDEDQI